MKKLILLTVLVSFVSANPVNITACGGGDYLPDTDYYNLFMQEIIDDPQYYPFLLTENNYYHSADKKTIKNENIEEWAAYLGISYENARYLVFSSSSDDLKKLSDGKSVSDENLGFITPDFTREHSATLHYLIVAKYLEPYMSISGSAGWDYYSEGENHQIAFAASALDYATVRTMLQKEWKDAKDKELKLRYGYQLVRFAHYSKEYDDAVEFFQTYVESLNHTPPMYYHALSQKAGALRGLGDIVKANADFFKVFAHSKNLKESALSSIRFTSDVSLQDFLEHAKTDQERNDVYLLLGYTSFNNPLNEIEKIVKSTPDAIQAKVLMARAINTLERQMLSVDNYFDAYYTEHVAYDKLKDRRYPLIQEDKVSAYLNEVVKLSSRLASSTSVKDKDFWHITTAYLYFLNKDFVTAREYLGKVETKNAKYVEQKQNLGMYIDICEQSVINADVEKRLFAKYRDTLAANPPARYFSGEDDSTTDADAWRTYSTYNFIMDIFANRYYLQKEYAKAFLLHNHIYELEHHPDLKLLNEIEEFFNKQNKNDFEKLIADRIYLIVNPDVDNVHIKIDVPTYINYIRGVIYLTDSDFDNALKSFSLMGKHKLEIPNAIFGYNRIECFDCDQDTVMAVDYLKEFPYIQKMMNEKQLVEVLIRLRAAGEQDGALAAKANYLLGNFTYNTTRTGYYRGILRFMASNSWAAGQYYGHEDSDIYKGIYFKYYHYYFKNNVAAAQRYLEKALAGAKDRELRARIVYALSKCEQEDYYDGNHADAHNWNYLNNDDGILVTNRRYFKELSGYADTRFYGEVATHCKYFDYFININ